MGVGGHREIGINCGFRRRAVSMETAGLEKGQGGTVMGMKASYTKARRMSCGMCSVDSK